MKKKRQISRDVLILSISTFVTVLAWIAFDVYRALTKSTIPEVLQEQMRILDPRIDKTEIELLKKRLTISEEELGKIVIPRPTPESIESTESATPSGGS